MKEKQYMYVNTSVISFGTYDFEIQTGIRKGSTQTNPPDPEDIDMVFFMSPQHTKKFSENLNRAIKVYEELYGKIETEPNSEAAEKYKSGKIE